VAEPGCERIAAALELKGSDGVYTGRSAEIVTGQVLARSGPS
jgi:hypothetical protein